jgi:hypothetical protein
MIAEPGIEDACSRNESPAASFAGADGWLTSLFRFRTQTARTGTDVQNVDTVSQNNAMPQKKIAMPQKRIVMPQRKVAIRPKKVAARPKKIAMPPRKIAMPQKMVAIRPKKVAVRPKKIAMPPKKIAMPQKKIAMPQKMVAIRPKKIAMPQKSGCVTTKRCFGVASRVDYRANTSVTSRIMFPNTEADYGTTPSIPAPFLPKSGGFRYPTATPGAGPDRPDPRPHPRLPAYDRNAMRAGGGICVQSASSADEVLSADGRRWTQMGTRTNVTAVPDAVPHGYARLPTARPRVRWPEPDGPVFRFP